MVLQAAMRTTAVKEEVEVAKLAVRRTPALLQMAPVVMMMMLAVMWVRLVVTLGLAEGMRERVGMKKTLRPVTQIETLVSAACQHPLAATGSSSSRD
jgi:hypothetical protein